MYRMADYKIAEGITGINEGGYANKINDHGGETYGGIARNFWPNWKGWIYIDKYKAQYTVLNAELKAKYTLAKWINQSAAVPSEPVQELKSLLYKQNFWNVNHLDFINDQQLANTVYDFGINSGTGRAADKLQDAYNVIKSLGSVPLKNDGDIGKTSLTAINSSKPDVIYTEYNKLREEFYRGLAKDPTQAEFLHDWLTRLKPYKSVA